MSFRRHIDSAYQHLESIGISPEVSEGTSISEKQLKDAEKEMQIAFPDELRRYFLELGDGFQLGYSAEPITGNLDDQFYWSLDFLEDILGAYRGIREDMERNIQGIGAFCTTDECRAESRRRINWIPIFGIGGGGYTFCIDANEGRGDIRYHDIRMSDGHWPSIHLAGSIEDWMRHWSRYCFSQPLVDETDTHTFLDSYCWEREGTFDWSPSKFRSKFDRDQPR